MLNVTVRPSRPADESGLARLAALDSARPLRGPALVAESDSRILAALPLGSGRPIADPFEPTAEIVALLELRKQQLAEAGRASGGRLRSLLRGSLSHARV
ncbi:MAG TPA: hypothetical protein VI122_03485 [Thermoleophilaceae bacterium]|jgi:hypothetical protein